MRIDFTLRACCIALLAYYPTQAFSEAISSTNIGDSVGTLAAHEPSQRSPEEAPEGLSKSDWQSIRAAHDAWKHEFREVDGRWQARNPGQGWTTSFDGRSFTAKPDAAEWTWGLQLQSYGFRSSPNTVSGSPEIQKDGQRLIYQWQDGLQEWFVNDGRGLEHGFIVKERPEGADAGEPLVFTLSTLGGLRPGVSNDALTVHFRDKGGAPILNYSGLKVWDADGKILSSRFERGAGEEFRIVIDEADANYPITIDPIAQQAFLKASNNHGPTSDNFGFSVAVSGDTVVVGASEEDGGSPGVNGTPNEAVSDSGAAYVFVRSGGTWSQQAYLKSPNPGVFDQFGFSVAVSGDTLIVGACREDGSATGVNGTHNDSASDSGAAYVFTRSGSTWSQQAYLKASNTGISDYFGLSVAAAGDTVYVGTIFEDGGTPGVNGASNESVGDSGAAYVFTNTGGAWSQQAYLKASNPGSGDNFGYSIAAAGDTVVIGAYKEDSGISGVNGTPNEGAIDSGAAYVFTRSEGTWIQQAFLKASNTGVSDQFGHSVGVSGDTVVVGANQEDSLTNGVNGASNESALNSGAAYVFTRLGGVWTQEAFLKASNTGAGDLFGQSVAVSGDTVVVGATQEDSNTTGVNSTPNESSGASGAAYVFTRSDGTWSQQAYLKPFNTGTNDSFGNAVAASGDTVIIGANMEDSSTTGVNGAPNETAANSGAAYVFTRSGSTWSQRAFLKASNTPLGTGVGDQFGFSVAVSGDTVVVGAFAEDSSTTGVNSMPNESAVDSGAAYVFTRNGSTWSQQAYLKAFNTGAGDLFGQSVAVSGDTVVVGANQEDSGTTGVNNTSNESASASGAAYVFTRSGGIWTQQAFLKASNTGGSDAFGNAVAVSGDTVVIGARQEDSSTTGVNSTPNDTAVDSGAAYVFTRSGGTWSQQAYLKASNTGASDIFGNAVAVSGDTVVVGANQEDSSTSGVNSTPNESAIGSGAAYVFTRNGSTWSQQAYLKPSNTGAGDTFGNAVAVSGNTVVVGSIGEDSSTTGVNSSPSESASNSGAAYVFVGSGEVWSEEAYLKASNTQASDSFGTSVAVSMDALVVGAQLEDSATTGVNSTPNEGASSAGAAYVFLRSGGIWSQQAYLKASNTGGSDLFGNSVGISGGTVVVGANGEDSGTIGVNSIPNESAATSGAAYIFTGLGPETPDISVTGNGLNIDNGDTTPGGSDHTDFGTAAVSGGAIERTFTIHNNGAGSLNLGGIPLVSIGGSSAFVVTGQPSSPSVEAGASITFTITFDPTAPGPANATVSIPNSDSDENPFTFSISGTGNGTPAAQGQDVSTEKNTSLGITLSGTDPESALLTYTVASDPTHGSLSGTEPNLTYTPSSGYVGADSFTFFVNDGTSDSAPATVTIQVNEPPRPDLTVTVSAPSAALTGAPFDYTIIANNTGDQAASGVGLTFALPAGLTVQSVTTAGGFTQQGTGTSPMTFTGGNLAVGGTATLTVRVTATSPVTYVAPAGSAAIDPSGSIAEHNETNNTSIQIVSTVVSETPVFTTQPTNQTIASGATATLTVFASGSPAPTYQWQLSTDGGSFWNNLVNDPTYSGVTTVTLTITSAQLAQTGYRYRALATNTAGSTQSNGALLTVQTIPAITTQPSSQTISNGSTATLSITTTGSPAPTYQWYQGSSGNISQPVGGATNPSFTTPSLTTTTNYWVRATNSQGSADSQTAVISIAGGNNANLSGLSLGMPPLSPGFNQLTTSYTSSVPISITSIRVTPTAVASGAGITVNGLTVVSGTESNPINLNPGGNLIQVMVTAPDLITTKTYSINMIRTEPPVVTTEPATGVGSFGAMLHGTVDPNGSATVYFEYGTTTSYGSVTPPQFVSGSNPIPFQATISGLPGGTMIHFRAVVSQPGMITNGMNRTFTTLPPPVIVVTGNPVVTAETAATLVGAVNTQGQQAEVFFEYGTTAAYGNSTSPRTIPAGSGLQDILEGITGLIPNTFYHVRLVSTSPTPVGGNNVVFQAKVVSGSGTGSPTAVPTVTTGAVVDVQDDAGTLKGTVNANGGTTTAYFEYGTTSSSLGQETDVQPIGNGNEDAEVSIPAANLLPGTRYYYRLMAENSLGLSVPGAEAFFDTSFSPPVVTTGSAEALTTTSVRISGTVQAGNADTAVEIIYGTNPGSLSDGIATTPALVTGDEETSVSADLEDLLQSVTYYYQVRAVNSGGTTLGEMQTFRVSTLSGLLQIFPDELDPADHGGSLQVNITPADIGAGWRLSGEQEWRLPGDTVTGLTSGDRVIEYRAISGYLAPSSETVTVVSGDPILIIARTYEVSGETGTGSLTVSIKPDTIAAASRPVAERAQWRLLGETDSDWKDSGAVSAGLPAGNHVVECKPIAGRNTPPPASVVVSDGATASAILTYYEADPTVGDLPEVLDFETVRDDESLPYAYVGQIRSDAGSSTGFVVRPRVVATVAHAVFDDGTLASATGLQWLFQRHRGVHEPTPMIPRGFYTLTGYAEQRAEDDSPGISTPESQHLDAAAMYFSEDAGRSGYSGYLASDLDENEFLISTALKTLVGYPIENIAADDLDRMHATTPEDITFTLPTGTTRTFTTEEIRSTGGGSGGPLCVLASNGKFYPAAIYLGGTAQTIVRAIDSDVAALFGFAEISGDSTDGSGRGSITATETSPVGTPTLGSLRVLIEPAGARTAGAGWRITSGAFLASGDQLDSLSPNTYGIDFSTVPGFEVPATPSVEITGGFLKTVTFTYEIIVPIPVINSAAGLVVNRGDTLEYQTTATNSPTTFSLSGLLPLGTVFDPATGRITGIAQEAGRFPVVVGVSNLGGTDTQSVEIVSLPVMSPQSVNAPYLESLEYQIVSSEEGEGVVFSASNLPPGLSLDTSTGLISGTPTTPGTYPSPISVSVGGATKTSLLTFEITGTAPEITGHPAASTAIEYGNNVVLTITTSGLPTPSVQWYRGNSGNVSQPVSGATSATFVSPTLTISTSFWARVTNLSGSADSTTAAVSVLPSTNANLAFLSLNAAPLSPSFSPAVTPYTASVPNSIGGIRLTPNPAVPVSTIKINGAPSPINSQSGPVMLAVGSNVITILVTAQNGTTTRTYTVTVTRAPAPTVITQGADGINDITATIRGTVNPRNNGTVFFEYGPTTAYGKRSAPQQVSGSSPLAVSALLSGLAGNQNYHYRFGFSDGGPPVFGQDMMFTTSPSRPLVVTGSAANVSETQATLIGIVNPRGSQTNVRFEYGTDPNSLDTFTSYQDIGSGTRVVEVTAAITGLSAGLTYYYRTVAQSAAFAEPVIGETEQFIAVTAPTSGDGLADSPPTVIGGSETATSIAADSVVFQATINPNDGSTLVYFEYGPTTAYGFESDSFRIGNGTENSLVTIPVENLESGVTYYFRAVAENAMGVVTGTGSSFTTTFPTPTVTTGEAEAISSRSARVNGTVNANGTTRDVYFKYGTDGVTFPLSVLASQLTADGSLDTPVFVDLVNLDEGVTYFYKVVATDVGEAEGTEGAVLSFNPSVLLGLIREVPDDIQTSELQGQVTVNLLPTGTGSWRFSGEQAWRASGETAGSLTEGDRTIEFRPVAGYIQPPAELITLADGDSPLVLERDYYQSASAGSGSLRVNLFPASLSDSGVAEASRAQWRLANDTDTTWRNSAQAITGLPAGTYLVESKAVTGWDTPVLTSVNVEDDGESSLSITYLESATPSGNPPEVVSFATGQDNPDLPYVHVGQVRSASGSFSGFVVKSKVVATVAQSVFDEATLATVTGLQWLQQRDSASHEPQPMEPRGSYLFLGYEAQRLAENTPGEHSLDSHDLNVAALYFFIDAGRAGYSGFLASDETDNEFLISAEPKILAGYPVAGIGGAAQGRMHATTASTDSFTWEQGSTFSSTAIRGLGGMAGGPLSVRYEGGDYYPAAIHLGGTDIAYVRAIDTDIIDIFTRAEVSGNGGDNNTDGGITQTSIVGSLSVTQPGSLRVNIEPAAAVTLGAGWKLMPESTLRSSGSQKSGLSAGSYNLELSSISGYSTPTIQTVSVSGGQSTTVTYTYAELTALELWRFENFATYDDTGDAADDNDFDHDDETNIEEYTAGTDPTDGSDVFEMATTAISGGTFTATCAGKAGRTYTLLRDSELSGTWTRLGSQGPLTGDGTVTLSDTSAPTDKSFYRIEVAFP